MSTPKAVGTLREVWAYCLAMEKLHKDGEQWRPFRIPQASTMRRYGEFGCCRASEQSDYERGGAVFATEYSDIAASLGRRP